MRRASVLLAFVFLACSCGGASAAKTTNPGTAGRTATLKRLHVVVRAESHHPRLGHTWTYWVRVTDASTRKPVACLIHVEVTFGGTPVGQIGRHHVKNGFWKETIPATGKNAFPPASVGQHVVWRATATAPGYRKGVGTWPISVVK
jgi:hypothetical protein